MAASSAHAATERARSAGAYLVRVQDEGGRFDYRYNPFTPLQTGVSYNIVRHAGTAWSLHRLATTARTRSRVSDVQSSSRSGSRSPADTVPAGRGRSPVRARRGDRSSQAGRARTRAAGYRRRPGHGRGVMTARSQALGRQHRVMQTPDGRFAATQVSDARKRTSLYYPGEAMLGLISLRATPSVHRPAHRTWRRPVVGHPISVARRRDAASRAGDACPPDAWFAQVLDLLWLDRPRSDVRGPRRASRRWADDRLVQYTPTARLSLAATARCQSQAVTRQLEARG